MKLKRVTSLNFDTLLYFCVCTSKGYKDRTGEREENIVK